MLRNAVMKPLTRLDPRDPQHVDMVWTTMYEMVSDMEPRCRLMMMSKVIPKMMDRCFEEVDSNDSISTLREILLSLIHSCYVRMSAKQRRKLISSCRAVLEDVEMRHNCSLLLS